MNLIYAIIILTFCGKIRSDMLQYFQQVATYFGYNKQTFAKTDVFDQHILYEVSPVDEKFISEAIKLTDTAISDLDLCQHRVVLKLQTSCGRMNDEQLSKMAVMLLNCQAAVEEREIYPCTDEMNIKDCTSSMDTDIWNIYIMTTNRVRAVCYSVRQVQFRALMENNVNNLMSATQNQLKTLFKISQDQESLQELIQHSFQSLATDNTRLRIQQKDLEKAQFYQQLTISNNINRLAQETQLITGTHNQLVHLSQVIQSKLKEATEKIESQTSETLASQQKLYDNLVTIQNEAQNIFRTLEESTGLLLKQSELAQIQHEATLVRLGEINATVYTLANVIKTTRQALEERIEWLNATLGGPELIIDRLYAITWHVGFLLLTMIGCAFLGVHFSTRIIVVCAPPLNLALTLQQQSCALNPYGLTVMLGVLIIVQKMLEHTKHIWRHNMFEVFRRLKQKFILFKNKSKKNYPKSISSTSTQSRERYKYTDNENNINKLPNNYLYNFTSSSLNHRSSVSRSRSKTPLQSNGFLRGSCKAKTRLGTDCKLSALPGREFCHRHQNGDSVYADDLN